MRFNCRIYMGKFGTDTHITAVFPRFKDRETPWIIFFKSQWTHANKNIYRTKILVQGRANQLLLSFRAKSTAIYRGIFLIFRGAPKYIFIPRFLKVPRKMFSETKLEKVCSQLVDLAMCLKWWYSGYWSGYGRTGPLDKAGANVEIVPKVKKHKTHS